MNYMIAECQNLYEINLSNFDIYSLTNMELMFKNSYKLEYINLQKYNETVDSLSVVNLLENLPENIVICIKNETNNVNKIMIEIRKKKLSHNILW